MSLKCPTAEQCITGERLGDGMFACWYPQMGGYVSKCIVMINDEHSGCFEAYIWHNGDFPISDDCSTDSISHIHHCEADQFIKFGNFIKNHQQSRLNKTIPF